MPTGKKEKSPCRPPPGKRCPPGAHYQPYRPDQHAQVQKEEWVDRPFDDDGARVPERPEIGSQVAAPLFEPAAPFGALQDARFQLGHPSALPAKRFRHRVSPRDRFAQPPDEPPHRAVRIFGELFQRRGEADPRMETLPEFVVKILFLGKAEAHVPCMVRGTVAG